MQATDRPRPAGPSPGLRDAPVPESGSSVPPTIGWRAEQGAPSEFDAAHYGAQLAQLGVKLEPKERWRHYLDHGARMGLDPAPWFETQWYLDQNPDVAQSAFNPFEHYLLHGRPEGRPAAPSETAGTTRATWTPQDGAPPEFDADYYGAQLLELSLVIPLQDRWEHYRNEGARLGLDPAPWFETRWYQDQNPDVVEAQINPFEHFLLHGAREGRLANPHGVTFTRALSSLSAPIARTPTPPPAAAVAAEADPTPRPAGAPPAEFDAAFYGEQLAHLCIFVDEAARWRHYITEGLALGLDPAPWFRSRRYLEVYPDVAEAGANPFEHYLDFGRAEGRSPAPGEDAGGDSEERRLMRRFFNARYYLATYPDVAAAGVEPFNHFCDEGWKEGRDPSPAFSTNEYLELNVDVRAAKINPFAHYLTAGRAEGRVAKPNLGFRHAILKGQVALADRIAAARRHAPPYRVEPAGALEAALGRPWRGDRALLLSFSHDDPMRNTGGVQLVLQREFGECAQAGVDQIHLYPAVPLLAAETGSHRPDMGLIVNGEHHGVFRARNLISAFAGLKGPWKERLAVIHSLLGHSAEDIGDLLAGAAVRRGFFWIHDYASLCTGYNLMRNDVQYCGAPAPESTACQICVYGAARGPQVEAHDHLFSCLDLEAVAPSQTALDIWRRRPENADRAARVLEHCRLAPSGAPARSRSGPLRIGFLGHPASHKGWPVFQNIAARHRGDPRYAFFHFGQHNTDLPGLQFRKVAVTSERSDAMVEAIDAEAIDVALIWSLWPETFCLTAYEACAGGAAILTNPQSGNVAAFAPGVGGRVLPGEVELERAFESGELLALARRLRRPERQVMTYSKLSVELLGGEPA